MPECDFKKVALATLLKSRFGMGVLLWICCIFSEHLFLRTPLEGCFWRYHWKLKVWPITKIWLIIAFNDVTVSKKPNLVTVLLRLPVSFGFCQLSWFCRCSVSNDVNNNKNATRWEDENIAQLIYSNTPQYSQQTFVGLEDMSCKMSWRHVLKTLWRQTKCLLYLTNVYIRI